MFLFKKKITNKYIVYKFLCLKFKFQRKDFIEPHSPYKQLGFKSYAGGNLRISSKETAIGKYCSLANNITVGIGQHPLNYLTTHPVYCRNPDNKFLTHTICHIGNDVWVGDDVSIMAGVNIGDGAVIETKAVVTKDVPPYAIVAGVPAKILRYRFENEIIKIF